MIDKITNIPTACHRVYGLSLTYLNNMHPHGFSMPRAETLVELSIRYVETLIGLWTTMLQIISRFAASFSPISDHDVDMGALPAFLSLMTFGLFRF